MILLALKSSGVEVGDTCIHIADSFHCTTETNTISQSIYTAIKKKKSWQIQSLCMLYYLHFRNLNTKSFGDLKLMALGRN